MNKTTITDSRPPEEVARRKSLLHVLMRMWTYPITTKSDFAREHADDIAELASRGLVSTAILPTGYLHGRLWKVTLQGLTFLTEYVNEIAEDEVANYVESFCDERV